MCVKFPPRDLNPGSCLPHPTSTYICRVTIAPRVCGGRPITVEAPTYQIVSWLIHVMALYQ